MVTMLDCIKRVPGLLVKIVNDAEQNYKEFFDKLDIEEINEICLIGSGTSYTSAYTSRFMLEKASGIRVSVILPNEFLYGCTVRNEKAVYVFISQTGTSTLTMKALDYCRERGFHTVGVSENRETPIAQKADVFVNMGCGKEEYGIRTIGYSTTVLSLMWLGVELGRKKGNVTAEEYADYKHQIAAVAEHIPQIIEDAQRWLNVSRRKMMKSAFFAFTGRESLYGVAMEASVKIWEAPQYPSGGYELDEGMHGPNYGYNGNHAVFVLNDGEIESEKAISLARYMKNEHENGYIIGVGALDEKDLAFTPVGGPFKCLEYAAAIQVLMYRLAVDGGRDFSILGIHSKMNSYFQAHTDVKKKSEKMVGEEKDG